MKTIDLAALNRLIGHTLSVYRRRPCAALKQALVHLNAARNCLKQGSAWLAVRARVHIELALMSVRKARRGNSGAMLAN